jgi:hypothetical protein
MLAANVLVERPMTMHDEATEQEIWMGIAVAVLAVIAFWFLIP